MVLKHFTTKVRCGRAAFRTSLIHERNEQTRGLQSGWQRRQAFSNEQCAQADRRHHTFEWILSLLNRFCAGGSSAGWPTTTNASGTTPSGSWQCSVNPATCPSIG